MKLRREIVDKTHEIERAIDELRELVMRPDPTTLAADTLARMVAACSLVAISKEELRAEWVGLFDAAIAHAVETGLVDSDDRGYSEPIPF